MLGHGRVLRQAPRPLADVVDGVERRDTRAMSRRIAYLSSEGHHATAPNANQGATLLVARRILVHPVVLRDEPRNEVVAESVGLRWARGDARHADHVLDPLQRLFRRDVCRLERADIRADDALDLGGRSTGCNRSDGPADVGRLRAGRGPVVLVRVHRRLREIGTPICWRARPVVNAARAEDVALDYEAAAVPIMARFATSGRTRERIDAIRAAHPSLFAATGLVK